MPSRRSFATGLLAGSAAMTVAHAGPAAAAAGPASRPSGRSMFPTRYRTVDVDGTSVFYREAGAPDAPVVLLLPGWPSSSAMFGELIRELSSDFRVVAPDHPGFGNSSLPDRSRGPYTFDALGDLVGRFIDRIGVGDFVLYATDFGGLVGYRLMLKTPGRVKALIVQNNPLFPSGSAWFAPLMPYWQTGTPESREQVRAHYLSLDLVRDLYLAGVPDPSLIDPGLWQADYALMQRPGAAEISLDLFRDIPNNGPTFALVQEYLRTRKPPTLIVSGKHDLLFPGENQLRYRELLPDAEVHLTDSGHCALADKSAEIGDRVRGFLARVL